MAAIFVSSAQTADVSSQLSGAVTDGVFGSIAGWLGIPVSASILGTLEHYLRKAAHLAVFATLGFCVANTVRHLTESAKRVFVISLCGCSFYAATDELHQLFVPGRACMWQDWLIDTIGVLIGVSAALLIAALLSRRKTHPTRKAELS